LTKHLLTTKIPARLRRNQMTESVRWYKGWA
jgi:hypothetical protein